MNHFFKLSFIVVMVSLAVNLIAQDIHLDVEGHVKIRGNIDIHHPEDSTSIFIGHYAGENSAVDQELDNTIVGSLAGMLSTTGNENSFFGGYAGKNNTEGSSNSFFGYGSGNTNTDGSHNSFFGSISGSDNGTGDFNSFLGVYSGGYNQSGSFNTSVGYVSGENNRYGSYNTFIGSDTGLDDSVLSDSLNKVVAIGFNARVACHNCAVIGGTGDDAVNVGIGTTTPTALLHIEGDNKGELRLRDIGNVVSINMQTQESLSNWLMKARSHETISETNDDASIIFQYGQDSLFRLKGNGNATLAGTLTENSDIRLKTNISMLTGVLPQLLELHGYTYNWLDSSKTTGIQIGLIAQEVNEAFPELIQEDESGVMSVSYTRFVPLLIEGIREQQVEINELKSLGQELIKRIEILENR